MINTYIIITLFIQVCYTVGQEHFRRKKVIICDSARRKVELKLWGKDADRNLIQGIEGTFKAVEMDSSGLLSTMVTTWTVGIIYYKSNRR